MPRAKLAALLAVAVIAGTISACSTFNPLHQQPQGQCYWLSNVTNQWEAREDVDTRATCQALDSCSGGGGESGGGCYKWTAGPNDPQNRW